MRNTRGPGGYLDDKAIKILLPPSLRPVGTGLRTAGQGPRVDDFVASMNHAAERLRALLLC